MKEDLRRYEMVNRCETLDELRAVILSFADDNGEILGRTRKFSASKMAMYCDESILRATPRGLTRNWGIRQQALYIINS